MAVMESQVVPENEIQPAAGRNPAPQVEILTPFGRNLRAKPANDEAPKPFRFRGFIYPGSYLLSRDLSSDKTPVGCKGG